MSNPPFTPESTVPESKRVRPIPIRELVATLSQRVIELTALVHQKIPNPRDNGKAITDANYCMTNHVADLTRAVEKNMGVLRGIEQRVENTIKQGVTVTVRKDPGAEEKRTDKLIEVVATLANQLESK